MWAAMEMQKNLPGRICLNHRDMDASDATIAVVAQKFPVSLLQ
jgi:hypothetical protein